MIYFIGFLLIMILIPILWPLLSHKKPKELPDIRREWGKIKTESRNMDLVASYYNNKDGEPLSDQTLYDLDFYDVFEFIDRTESKVGQQYLFHLLTHPRQDINELTSFNEKADFLTNNQGLREEVQLLLAELNSYDAYYITTLLNHKLYKKPGWARFLIADTILVLLLLILSPFYPFLLILLMIPLAANLFIHYKNKQEASHFIRSFPQLNLLINVSRKLVAKTIPFKKEKITSSINALKSFQRKFQRLNLGKAAEDNELMQMAWLVYELVKAFFLVDVYAFHGAVSELENKQEDISNLFAFIGSIDTAISVASLRAGDLPSCRPEFINAEKELVCKSVSHPLIEDCVPNSIDINNKSILITGSNMSGKTTFIRTIAINTILARSICTCFAESFRLPLLKVASSIRVDDDLLEGKSYYLQEVNNIASLIQKAATDTQHLFILDEVFKGTNTVERISSAKAVLSYLNSKNHIVLVCTHDLELADLLKEHYDLYHFVEDVAQDKLYFDHKLKSGKLSTTNAIKILQLSNFPETVIEEARELAETFHKFDKSL